MTLGMIIALPLIGFLINGLWYAFFQIKPEAKKASSAVTGTIATLAIFGSFLLSLKTFLELKGMPESERFVEQLLFHWITVGSFNLDFALRVDSLSTLFTLVITGVGTLIHIYSIGYMSHDETPGKFFCYLNLFCFAMLVLVMGSSLPVLFFGWEGVGLCSYLLIGYWYKDEEKASAGKKAFIVNRIGDFAFIIGMFLIFTNYQTLDFVELTQKLAIADVSTITITAICLLLFFGCTGKSAQIPLYVWLPDAMAGPTPVSALIHAATMVTSGVYLLARLNKLYILSPDAMHVIAIIGGLTALLAATIAITQRDIKKVLAYSTVSQLGYMFLACGVGAFGAGVFHVITHAFFKALMFLGAGSVIHGMHEEQDIMKMGGLKSKMPVTFVTFLMGWLAICGLPPFSGFFSKDEILWNVFANIHGSKVLWVLAAATAAMTAFYMTRMFYLTFLGEHRAHASEAHESSAVMTIPLIILAILSVVGGFMGIPHRSWLEHWLSPVIAPHTPEHFVAGHTTELFLMAFSTVVALISIVFAFKIYRNLSNAEERKNKNIKLHRFLENKWFVDEFYERIAVTPIYRASIALWKSFDVAVIDRAVLMFGRVSFWTGQTARVVQTGAIQSYVLVLLLGLVITVGYLIYGLV